MIPQIPEAELLPEDLQEQKVSEALPVLFLLLLAESRTKKKNRKNKKRETAIVR
jgi:hypothetical protein